VVKTLPEFRIYTAEQALCIRVPGPPKVVSQFPEAGYATRQIKMIGYFCAKYGHLFFLFNQISAIMIPQQAERWYIPTHQKK